MRDPTSTVGIVQENYMNRRIRVRKYCAGYGRPTIFFVLIEPFIWPDQINWEKIDGGD